MPSCWRLPDVCGVFGPSAAPPEPCLRNVSGALSTPSQVQVQQPCAGAADTLPRVTPGSSVGREGAEQWASAPKFGSRGRQRFLIAFCSPGPVSGKETQMTAKWQLRHPPRE